MRIASIGSGSEGNGTLIEVGDTCVLVDCGFSAREAERRLVAKGINPAKLSGILVTHEHADHVKGVALLANRFQIPVYITWGSYTSNIMQKREVDRQLLNIISPHEMFSVGGLKVEPVPVPHDAREPNQFVIYGGGFKLGILSDTGCITPHMERAYAACDALLLECNHDLEMLRNGPYPQSLKRRVAGQYGHLNNDQAADLLSKVEHEALQHIVITHISQKNNHPELALGALNRAVRYSEDKIVLADQNEGFDWLALQICEIA